MKNENSFLKAENQMLKLIKEAEELAEKKAKIYSRLLIDPTLAEEMERLSLRHSERREKTEKYILIAEGKNYEE